MHPLSKTALTCVVLLATASARAQTPAEDGTDPNVWVFDSSAQPVRTYRVGVGPAESATAGILGVTVHAADGTAALLPGTSPATTVLVSHVEGSLPRPTALPPMSVTSLAAATANVTSPTKPGLVISPSAGQTDGSLAVAIEAFPSATGVGPVTLLVSVDGGFATNVGATQTTLVFVTSGTHTVTATATQGAVSTSVTASFTLTGTDAKRRDTDGDGIPDLVEVELGRDAFAADARRDGDGDGWSDLDEALRGSDADDPSAVPADADGDGWSDWDEALRGTDPDDASSKPVAVGLDGVELLVSGAIWSDDAHLEPAVGDWDVTLMDVSWRDLAATGAAPTFDEVRVPGDSHLVVTARLNDFVAVRKALVLGAGAATPDVIGALIIDAGQPYADAAEWLELYATELANYVVRATHVDVDPHSGIVVGLAEAAVAWAGAIDFGAPVLLGERDGAIAPEAAAEVASTFSDLVSFGAGEASAAILVEICVELLAPPESSETTSFALARRLQRPTPEAAAWDLRYQARLIAYEGLARIDAFEPLPGVDPAGVWSPEADSDSDGVTNGDELAGGLDVATDPLYPDSDDDGVGDLSDPCPRDASNACGIDIPFSADADEDGILDGLDNCFGIANPTQTDTNGDGIGDACDRPARIATPAANLVVLAPTSVLFEARPSATANGSVQYRWRANGVDMATTRSFTLDLTPSEAITVTVSLLAADADTPLAEVDRRSIQVRVDDGPVPCLALDCDDGDPCTTDTCDLVSGCAETPVPGCLGCGSATDCDDLNLCTREDCVGGVCERGNDDGVACSDGSACTTGDACLDGACRAGTPIDCDDHDPCTIDSCSAALGCAHTPDPSPDPVLCPECDDDSDCAEGACVGGGCCLATAFADGVARTWNPGDAAPVLCLFAGTELDMAATSGNGVTLKLRDPNNAQVASSLTSKSVRTELESALLSGKFTLAITGTAAVTYTINQSFDVETDLTGFAVKSRLTTVAIGSEAFFYFDADAGDVVTFLGEMATPSGCPDYTLLDPLGTLFASDNTCGNSYFLEPRTLDLTGTWTVLVDPGTTLVGDIDMTVWQVPPRRIVPIALDGVGVTELFETPGQTVAWQFDGTAGERVSFQSVDPQCADHYILTPSGAEIYSGASCDNIFSDGVTLTETGPHLWLVDPRGAALPNETVRGWVVPADPVVGVSLGGAAMPMTFGIPGQNGRYEFAATAGDIVSIVFTGGLDLGATNYALKSPAGVTLASQNTGGSPYFDRRTLNETGTYAIIVNPSAMNLGTITAQVFVVPPDVTGTLTVGGGSLPFAITTPGQNAAPTFAGLAGQSVKIVATATGTNIYSILRSDGTVVFSSGNKANNYTSGAIVLPIADTYTLLADPISSGKPTFTLAVAPL